MSQHIIQIELPTHVFNRRDSIPETMRYRVNNPALDDLLQEIEDAFWLDLGADHCFSNPPRLSIGRAELIELIGWAQRQLAGSSVSLWEGVKAQMYRWDTEIPLTVAHASVVAIIREDSQWKVTHVAYLTPEQFQQAIADGALGRRDRSTMRLGEWRTTILPLDLIPSLLRAALLKRHAHIAYDQKHPAVNNITGRDRKRRVLPAAKADSARLDWLAERIKCRGGSIALRKFIDHHREQGIEPDFGFDISLPPHTTQS